MEKQEQIEEMRREIYYARCKVNGIATSNDIAERLYSVVERKIEELKSENKQLKTEVALLDEELRSARQTLIDVLNRVKEKLNTVLNGWVYTTYIDELLKEYENGKQI